MKTSRFLVRSFSGPLLRPTAVSPAGIVGPGSRSGRKVAFTPQ